MSDAPESKLTPEEQELRAAQEALRLQREARDEAKRAERAKRDAARVTQRAKDEAKLAEIEDELGEDNVKAVFFEQANDGRGGMAVVKRPKHAQYVNFTNKGKDDYHSLVSYVTPNLVVPPIAELEAWLVKEPFKITSLSGCCHILAGVTVSDSLAK